MRLSARADYALRAAIELATADGRHVTAEQLARAQKIPGKFLEAILTQLRRAGLVRSQRGPEGGFWLARPAEDISLADIIRAIDGQLVGVRGERPENIGYIGAAEPLQSVWIALRANERAIARAHRDGSASGPRRRTHRRPPRLGLIAPYRLGRIVGMLVVTSLVRPPSQGRSDGLFGNGQTGTMSVASRTRRATSSNAG
jgi:Rrf2 family protein